MCQQLQKQAAMRNARLDLSALLLTFFLDGSELEEHLDFQAGVVCVAWIFLLRSMVQLFPNLLKCSMWS